MARLLILSLNYAPEPTGFAPHTAALAEHLVKVGHDVTVVTGFPFSPRWRRWPEYRGELICDEQVNNVRVARVTHFIPSKPGRVIAGRYLQAFDGVAKQMKPSGSAREAG